MLRTILISPPPRSISTLLSPEDFLEQMKKMRKMRPLTQSIDKLAGQFGQAARQVDPKDIEHQ